MKKNTELLTSMKDLNATVTAKIKSVSNNISVEDVLNQAIHLPGVKINRSKFLRKELQGKYSKSIIELAIRECPAAAYITREEIDCIAKSVIGYETNKVSGISFAAGLPGGAAMAATIPADTVQYFGFVLRIMQELAYLYGFPEIVPDESEVGSDVMNELLLFLGVMFGVQEASTGVKLLANTMSKTVAKRLAKTALTKTTIYPIVKKIASKVGIHMTKQIFANGVSKAIPLVGGLTSGGLTYVTFKSCANRLKTCLESLNLSDPDVYYQSNIIDDTSF